MKNFDDKEKQIQEICNTIRTASDLDIAARLVYDDILKLVRKSFYEGHDAGVQTMTDIQLKNQEKINELFKNL
jgi:hypothetical protein